MILSDIVTAECPTCGGTLEMTSESMAASFDEYTVDDAPAKVLAGISDTTKCRDCGSAYDIEVKLKAKIKLRKI